MERSVSDESAVGPRGEWRGDNGSADVSMAVAESPASLSAAHWANRDNDTLYRRPGHSGTFRRPPAENSFPDAGAGAQGMYADHQEPFEPHEPPGPLGPSGEEFRSRHWTTIGDGARRPRTSDRDEVNAPEVRDPEPTRPDGIATSWFGGMGADAPVPDGGAPGQAGGAAGQRGDMPVGWPAPGPHGARPSHGRPGGEPTPGVGMDGLLGGPGRDIRPHRAGRRDPLPTAAAKDQHPPRGTAQTGEPHRRRSRTVLLAVSLAVTVLLGGAVAGMVLYTDATDGITAVLRGDAGPSDPARSVTAPLSGRSNAAFDVVTGTARVTMRGEDLGDNLYRITSAEDSGTVPRTVLDGDRVQLHLAANADGVGGNVEVVLSTKVRWALRFTGGADEQIVDLTGANISSVDFAGGARRIELTLPSPTGTVGVRLTGAVDEFAIKAPKVSPVRVHVDSGAKTVAAGERTLRDVAPGSTLTPRNWQVEDRYDVDAASRVTLLSVRNEG